MDIYEFQRWNWKMSNARHWVWRCCTYLKPLSGHSALHHFGIDTEYRGIPSMISYLRTNRTCCC